MTATGIFPAFQSVMSLLDFISLTSKRFLIRDTFQGEWKPHRGGRQAADMPGPEAVDQRAFWQR